MDVAYAADGETVVATLARDNGSENGGGIWISRNAGTSWSRPSTWNPPKHKGVADRISPYGISYSPTIKKVRFSVTKCKLLTLATQYTRRWIWYCECNQTRNRKARIHGIRIYSSLFSTRTLSDKFWIIRISHYWSQDARNEWIRVYKKSQGNKTTSQSIFYNSFFD